MKIQLLSDLHIEFEDFDYPECECDIVVLAGDIHTKDRGVKWAMENITKPCLYVLGNHEYYGKTYPKLIGELKQLTAGTHVHVLEDDIYEVGETAFFGTTLWTDFEILGDPRIAGYHCQQVMTDYKKIKKLPGYSKIRSLDTHLIHRRSVIWLEQAISESKAKKKVVVTHHAPSIQSIEAHYHEDLTVSAYASNLESFIQTHQPDIWLHGHAHSSADYIIGDTNVVCNPKGYPGELNLTFSPIKTVDI